jgi:hypothetical protein
MTDFVEFVSQGNIMAMLLFTAFVCLVLGMGVPTTANYILVATLMAPVIVELGAQSGLVIPLIAVHLFVFYYGIMGDITPPVGLATFAGAAIAKENPIDVGLQGSVYAFRTVVLPFIWIFNPALLIDVHGWAKRSVAFMSTIASLAFAAATFGSASRRWWEVVLATDLLPVPLDRCRPDCVEYTDAPASSCTSAALEPGDRLVFLIKGQSLEGEDTQKTVGLQLLGPKGAAGNAVADARKRLSDAGVSVSGMGEMLQVSTVRFGSTAAKARIEPGFEIVGVKVPTTASIHTGSTSGCVDRPVLADAGAEDAARTGGGRAAAGSHATDQCADVSAVMTMREAIDSMAAAQTVRQWRRCGGAACARGRAPPAVGPVDDRCIAARRHCRRQDLRRSARASASSSCCFLGDRDRWPRSNQRITRSHGARDCGGSQRLAARCRTWLFGAGVQAHAHRARCFFRRIGAGRAGARIRDWVQTELGVESAAVDAVTAAHEADVICTATRAAEPLFDGALVKAGAFVAAVGSSKPAARELDDTLLARADLIVVEWLPAAQAEAGEFARAAPGTIDPARVTELGKLMVKGRSLSAPARHHHLQVGRHRLEDIALANLVWQKVN